CEGPKNSTATCFLLMPTKRSVCCLPAGTCGLTDAAGKMILMSCIRINSSRLRFPFPIFGACGVVVMAPLPHALCRSSSFTNLLSPTFLMLKAPPSSAVRSATGTSKISAASSTLSIDPHQSSESCRRNSPAEPPIHAIVVTSTAPQDEGTLPWDYPVPPPHTSTRFPPRSPCHNNVEQRRNSRFFHSSEFANASSSGLNRLKTDSDATRISFLLARLRATVSRRGSRRNSPDSNR